MLKHISRIKTLSNNKLRVLEERPRLKRYLEELATLGNPNVAATLSAIKLRPPDADPSSLKVYSDFISLS